MRLIKPSFEILEQGPGLRGIYKQIELAGRTCYKSLDKITDDSAEGFVNRMITSKHYAMLEHGTVCLKVQDKVNEIGMTVPDLGLKGNYSNNPYSRVNYQTENIKLYDRVLAEYAPVTTTYITTNLRVLVENGWFDDLKYLCEPTEFHKKRVTVRFTTSNSIMREFTRHRSHSFAVESTRYCNYSKDKFNNEITFIEPSWFNKEICDLDYIKYPTLPEGFFPEYDYSYWEEEKHKITKEAMFIWSLLTSEKAYLEAIRLGAKPQEAREVLPLATKCDMVMTGFVSDWEHFFDLRSRGTTGAPHPDAKALADPLMHEFETRQLI